MASTVSAPSAVLGGPPPVPLVIQGIPLTGAKSRVETQVKLTLSLSPDGPSAAHDLERYSHVRLQKGTATKRKSRKQSLAEPSVDPVPESLLWLETEVYCATEGVPENSPQGTLGRRVLACASCRTREIKRSQRKLAARVKPTLSDSDLDEPSSRGKGAGGTASPAVGEGNGESSVKAGSATPGTVTPSNGVDERHKIVLFNCAALLTLTQGEVQLPARVTCYCRHHREKLGFIIRFTLRNSAGHAVAVGFTPPLMITDDHKSSEKSTEAAAKAAAAAAAAVGLPAPQHITGSTPVSRAGSASGRGPKVLIMPSNPPSALANESKKMGNGHMQATPSAPTSTSSRSSSSGNGHSVADGAATYRGSTAPSSSAVSAYAASTAASTAPSSRTQTNGTVSPAFAALTSITASALSTAVSTPLPAALPLPRGTKRAAVRGNGESSSLSPNEEDSSSTSSDTTRHHLARKQRTATASSSTPYDRRSSPAGSSLSGASSVLGTPHFPCFGISTALPQMEDPDDGSFDFALDGGLDRPAGSHLPAFSADSPPSASAIGLAGLSTGESALSCDPGSGEMRIELGAVDDMLFSMEARPHDKTRSPALGLATDDGCDTSDAYHRAGGSFYRPTFTRTGSDADMSFDATNTAENDVEVEAMSFDSLVDYEGGSSCATGSAFSPQASNSASSRRETSASSGTSSDSDSMLGGTGLSGPHPHWPSIYPSALNNPNNIQISYPQPYVVPTPPAPPPLPRPSISRLIPAEGPLAGGIEVTLLGVNFLQGMVAFFGENRAPMTSCWNDGTIICTVPPGVVAGSVPVVLRMEGRAIEGPSGTGGQLFTYKDASDRALLELALQVVGLKMTGRIEDAKNVALRILGQGSFATNVPTSSAANTASGSGNVAALVDAISPAAPSEKTAFQRIQSTYESAAITMTGRSKYSIPPLAVSQDDKKHLATAEVTQLAPPQTKEEPPSWAAATAAQARRLTEREIARYGHQSARKSGKGGKYDKMLWFFWLPVLICFAIFFAITHLPSLVGDVKRVSGRYLPFKGLLTAQ